MKRCIPILFVLLSGLITGCQSDDAEQPEEVQILVALGKEETVMRSVDGARFVNGDKFRFFFNSELPQGAHSDPANTDGSDTDYKQTDYTYDGKKWTTLNPIYWDDHRKIEEREFCAVLPFSLNYQATETKNDVFNIQTNQSIADSTAYKASDLLIARIKTNKRLIPLRFFHVLSKVNVNVIIPVNDNNDDKYNNHFNSNIIITDVSLNNIKPVANITYSDLTILSTGIEVTTTASGTITPVNMLCTKAQATNSSQVTASYTAIIPQQSIAASDLVVTFSINVDGVDKEYYFKHTAPINYEQGKATTLTITLGKSKVDLDIDITEWSEIVAKDDNPIKL